MTSTGQRKSSIPISGDRDKPTKATGTINPPTSLKGKSLTKNRPELTVQNDNTWKDMIRHEKLVIKLWNWKWDFLLLPENKPKFHSVSFNSTQRMESIDKKLAEEGRRLGLIQYQKLEKREYKIKPSGSFPNKSSEWIGWRSKDRENSFDFYRTPSTNGPGPTERVPKISFVKEQYGVYRQLKYLKEDKKNKISTQQQDAENKNTQRQLPTKNILHKVKPLLC